MNEQMQASKNALQKVAVKAANVSEYNAVMVAYRQYKLQE
jgi:hypothetical protein